MIVGSHIKFTAPTGFSFNVKMGDTQIDSDNGVFDIKKVTDKITIDVNYDFEYILSKFYINNKHIGIPLGYSVNDFSEELINSIGSSFDIYDADNQKKNADEYLKEDDKFFDYSFAFMGDVNNDKQYTVTDLTSIVEAVLSGNTDLNRHDISLDNSVTVSDIVKMRRIALNFKQYNLDAAKLSNEKSKITNDAVYYGITEDMLSAGIANQGNRTMVANAMKKALNGEDVTIAFLGGSITYGAAASNRDKTCYAALVRDWWERMFPGQIKFINAGISGTNSNFGIYRLEADILSNKPDILIVEFAVNDGNGSGSFQYNHEAIIRKAMKNNCAVIQLFMTANSYGLNCGQVTHGPTGKYYDVPQISMRDALYGKNYVRSDGQTFVFWDETQKNKSILSDGTHPNDTGYAMTATLINNYLNKVYENINNISTDVLDVNETPKHELAPIMENVEVIDPANHVNNENVSIVSLGDFKVNTSGDDYKSNVADMFGVSANSVNAQPLVISVKNCHVFSVISDTQALGYFMKVEVYDANTKQLLHTDDSNVNTQYGSSKTIRTHNASYTNADGKDVLIKISPNASKSISNANICI